MAEHWFRIIGRAFFRPGADAVPGAPVDPPPPPPPGDPVTTRACRLPPDALEGEIGYAVTLPFRLVSPVLRTDANGGASLDDGKDIRLETNGGTALAYIRTFYDGAAGVLEGYILMPAGLDAAGLEFVAKLGDAAGSDQSDPSGALAGYYFHLGGNGVDRTPSARSFAMGAGMVLDTDRRDAFVCPGDAFALMEDVSWREGLPALHQFLIIRAGAGMQGTDIGWQDQATRNTTGGNRTGVARHRTSPWSGSTSVDTIFLGERLAGGFAHWQGPAGLQVGADWTSIASNFAGGVTPTVYINGHFVEPSSAGSAEGTTVLNGPDLTLGRNGQDNTPWLGAMGANQMRSYAYGLAETQFLHRVIGLAWNPWQVADSEGNFAAMPTRPELQNPDTPAPETAPTAVDDTFTTQKNTAKTVAVLDNDVPGSTSIDTSSVEVVTPPATGTAVSNSNGTITFTPATDFVGERTFSYRVAGANGLLSNTALVTGTVEDVAPDPDPDPPPSGDGTPLPTALRTVNVSNQTAFNNAYSGAIPGDHIVLQTSGLSIPNSNNWAKSGSQSNPIVIRADTILGRTIGANFNVNASDVILYGLDLPSRLISVGNSSTSSRVKFWRCRWRNLSAPSTSMGLRTYATNDIDVAYCSWINWGGRGISFGIAGGTRRPVLRRCYFGPTPSASYTNGHEAVQVGFGRADRLVNSGTLIEENLFEEWNSDDEAISVKSSNCVIRRCRFLNIRSRAGNRMGTNNRWEAILCSGSGGMRIHDRDNVVLGCDVSSSSNGLRIATGNVDSDTTNWTSNLTPNAKRTYVGGNTGTVQIGAAYTGMTEFKVTNTTVRQHSGSVNLVSGNHVGTDSQPGAPASGYSWVSTIALTSADVGPSAGL